MQALEALNEGHSVREVASELGVPKSTVGDWKKAAEARQRREKFGATDKMCDSALTYAEARALNKGTGQQQLFHYFRADLLHFVGFCKVEIHPSAEKETNAAFLRELADAFSQDCAERGNVEVLLDKWERLALQRLFDENKVRVHKPTSSYRTWDTLTTDFASFDESMHLVRCFRVAVEQFAAQAEIELPERMTVDYLRDLFAYWQDELAT